MKTLSFIKLKAINESKKTLEVYRNAVFEINNLLTVPMKILDLTVEKSTSDGIEYNSYHVVVDDCADETEWDNFVSAFVVGFNSKSRAILAGVK